MSSNMDREERELSIDDAITELNELVNNSADMYHQLKKIKFQYLEHTCALFSRIDFPSVMITSCRKDIEQALPKAQDFRNM